MSSEPLEQFSRAELLDGDVIAVRRLCPTDADDVAHLYDELSEDDRYLRFFTMRPAHLQAWARSLTEHSGQQYAVGAYTSDKLLGVANYVACDTPGDAEVAVVVAHDQHLRGVGTALLRRLGEIAKENGIQHFVADVLAENHLMLHLLSEAGWPCTRHRDGSVLHLEVDLNTVG